MTREGLVTYLRSTEKRLMVYECKAEGFPRECIAAERNALRAALALLTPPTTAEIETARAQFKMCECGEPDCSVNRVNSTLDRALDALAREPGLEADVEDLSKRLVAFSAWRDSLMREHASLEAQVARVREHAQRWAGGTSNEAIFGDMILDALAVTASKEPA